MTDFKLAAGQEVADQSQILAIGLGHKYSELLPREPGLSQIFASKPPNITTSDFGPPRIISSTCTPCGGQHPLALRE